MDPYTLSVAQLKDTLRMYGLPTSGRKIELINRMQHAHPNDDWVREAAERHTLNDDQEEEAHILYAEADPQEGALRASPGVPDAPQQMALTSARSSNSSITMRSINIKEVNSLLCAYTGSSEDIQ